MGSLCLLCIISFFLYHLFRKYTFRWFTGTCIYLLLFTLGTVITEFHLSSAHYQWPVEKSVYKALLTENPQEKERSILCPVTVMIRQDSLGIHPIQKKVLLYLTKDSLSKQIKRGDKILFYGQINAPRNNGNPEEFDYASYLIHQGISGTAFAYTGSWKPTGHDASRTLEQTALDYRTLLLGKIKSLGFSGDEYTVLSALVLGYQNELSEEIRESYSISGASHVLSLSGLHIGFLYFLLDFLLGFANRRKDSLIAKQLIIVVLLWGFAFLTGLLSPVIRSVIMFSLIALSKIRNNQPVTLNTLAVAALLMLIYNPFYLYDVSFQLSFSAVAGIVMIQPWLYNRIKVENRIVKYVWGLMSVSIAAQIITAPIVLYYFSRFSTHFLLTNIIVVPLVSVIMYLAVFTLCIGFIPPLQALLAYLLKESIKLLNGTVVFVEHLPYSSIDHIWLNTVDVAVFYLIFLFFSLYFVAKKRWALFSLLSCILVLFLFHAEETYKHQNIRSIVFYNARNCPTVHLIESRETSYLFSAEKDDVHKKLRYAARRFWDKNQLNSPQTLPSEYSGKEIWRHNNMLCFEGKTICMIKDNSWRNKISDKPLYIDYLYICKGYKGKLVWLMPLFNAKKVVIDGSISDYHKEAFKKECTLLGMNFISLSEKGAFQIAL
ncbi:ComEC/Rec2 family competence protein [uncultured Bacteroides sp.]|uniref:ComEC/Rec2 family competence protein n=1 Tax=uncultured Bacteroides sp. TaxID=162156 RepID=UPI002AAB27D1|nr:ComEC/Rec2 family competence protein [uncultured Bacteroides sp.]